MPSSSTVQSALSTALLTILSESWELCYKPLNMPLHEISSLYHHWSATSELTNTPLLKTSQPIFSTTTATPSAKPPLLLPKVQDTTPPPPPLPTCPGVPIPTLSAAHMLLTAGSDRRTRLEVFAGLGGGVGGAKKQRLDEGERAGVTEDLRLAVYAGFLAGWVQAVEVLGPRLEGAVREWEGSMAWAGGVVDVVMEEEEAVGRVLGRKRVVEEVRRCYPALKRTVLRGVEWDAHIPTLSASLEYFKCVGAKQLPTQFAVAQLDYWNKEGFDLKSEEPAGVEKKQGRHHGAWDSPDDE